MYVVLMNNIIIIAFLGGICTSLAFRKLKITILLLP